MPEKMLKIVGVFIGSPGGLDAERKVAKRVVDEINESHADNWGCQIRLVGWEATLPGYSRAQSLINQDLDKCDYFVGVLWDHWGSQTDDGDSKYTSGFEEEFERAKKRVEAGLMKDIALYFKEIDERQLKDQGPSLKNVIAFRESCAKKRKPLYRDFKEGEFEGLLRAKISAIGWDESRALKAEVAAITDPGQPAVKGAGDVETAEGVGGLWGPSSLHFINMLLGKPAVWDALDSSEVARFRLIALGVSRVGNDDMYLGNHDANLLFARRHEIDFGHREVQSLTDAGIAGYDHQNVPLWGWMARGKPEEIFDRPKLTAAVGNDQERANAIRILQGAGLSTPVLDDFFTRERVLEKWLADERSDKAFNAALDFLKTNGAAEDLAVLNKRLEALAPKRKSSLAFTIVHVLAKLDIAKAFERLIQLNPDGVGESGTALLFAAPKAIPTATAELCLTLKADNVRRAAAQLLHSRKAIDAATAERLVADTGLEVRLIGAECLCRCGKPLAEEALKKLLTKERWGGLFGFVAGSSRDADDSLYLKYHLNRLSELGFEELRTKAAACNVFDHLELTALYNKFTRKLLTEMRGNLTDKFETYFKSKLERLKSWYRDDSKVLADTKKLESFLRKTLTNKTLDALCEYSSSADLQLIREVLDYGEIDFSVPVLRYLGRYGDWSDRNRIIAFSDRYGGAYSVLTIPSDAR